MSTQRQKQSKDKYYAVISSCVDGVRYREDREHINKRLEKRIIRKSVELLVFAFLFVSRSVRNTHIINIIIKQTPIRRFTFGRRVPGQCRGRRHCSGYRSTNYGMHTFERSVKVGRRGTNVNLLENVIYYYYAKLRTDTVHDRLLWRLYVVAGIRFLRASSFSYYSHRGTRVRLLSAVKRR